MYGTVQAFKKTSNRPKADKKETFSVYGPERLKDKIDEIVEKSDEYENRSQYIVDKLNNELKRCNA